MANDGLGLTTITELLNRAQVVSNRAAMDRRSEIGAWNQLLGGKELMPFETAEGTEDSSSATYRTNDYSKGVFAENPGCTPKYNTRNDQNETMARLLVPLPSHTARRRFVESFGADNQSRELAEALAVTEESAGPKGDGRYGMGYIDFLLMAAVEQHEEKVQVVDVLSDNFVQYFFGEHPPIFQYQGKLLNTEQDDWRNAFSIVYNSIIRGTQLARRRRLVTLTYDNVAVTGTVLGMSQTLTGDMEMAADFSFKFLVKRFDVYRKPGITFNSPSGFPNNVVNPKTFGGLQLSRVRRTMRTVADPQYVVSKPKSAKDDVTDPGGFDDIELPPTPEEEQKQADLLNPGPTEYTQWAFRGGR